MFLTADQIADLTGIRKGRGGRTRAAQDHPKLAAKIEEFQLRDLRSAIGQSTDSYATIWSMSMATL